MATPEGKPNIWQSTPWAAYNTYRPAYPPNLFDLILDHHRKNGGSFESAHDVGAGAGQAASRLAPHFSMIYLSDPSEHNVNTARDHLTSEAFQSSLPHACSFNFSTRTGESDPTADGWIAPQSLDLITVCSAMHWMDPDAAVASFAKQLKPGGTLAIVYYSGRPVIRDEPRADELWTKLLVGGLKREIKRNQQITDARKRSGMALEFVGLPEGEWKTRTRRLYINTGPDPENMFNHFMLFDTNGAAPRRVAENDVIEVFDDVENWSKVVDKDWFLGYIMTLRPQGNEGKLENDEEETLVQELKAEIGDKKVHVVWPVNVLLATRA